MTDRPTYELQPTTALPDEPIVTDRWPLPEPRLWIVADSDPYPFFWWFAWSPRKARKYGCDDKSSGFWFRIWGYGLRVSTEGVEVLKP